MCDELKDREHREHRTENSEFMNREQITENREQEEELSLKKRKL